MTFCKALSFAGRSTTTSTTPHKLMVPASTVSPTVFSTGVASPVRLDSSLAVLPLTISASTGNSEPGFTSRRCPARNASTATSRSWPSESTRVATLGAVRNKERISRWVRPMA